MMMRDLTITAMLTTSSDLRGCCRYEYLVIYFQRIRYFPAISKFLEN